MRHLVGIVALVALSLHSASAQDVIPPRYHAIAKDGRFRLKNILGSPEMHPAFNPTTAFSADGKRAIYVEDLTSGADDKPLFRSRLMVWDVEKKSWPREIELDGKSVTALALSDDGKRALLAGLTMPEKAKVPRAFVSLLDLQNGKDIKTFLVDEHPILTVAWSPDETSALTGTFAHLKRWNLKTGKEVGNYGEKGKINATALAYLPGGKRFLSGSQGATVWLWDVDNGNPLRTHLWKGDHQFTWLLAPSKDGKRFVAANFHGSLTVWDTATGKEVGTQRLEKPTIEEAILAAALADDNKTVLSVWGKQNPAPDDFACARLVAWDAETNKTLWSSIVPYRGRLPFLVKGDKLLVGGGPNRFDVWNVAVGKHLETWGGHKGTVNAVAVRADGHILSAGLDPVIFVWGNGRLQNKIAVDKSAVTALTMSKDGQSWLRAGADLTMRHTPPNNGRSVFIASGHKGPITSVAYSNDGKWACSGSGDRSIKTWKLKGGSEIATITGHSEGVNAVAVSPDDRWIASASDDATVRLWPVKDGKPDPDRDVVTLEKHKKAVTCLMFSPDGKRLISGSQDQTLIAWDWQKGGMDFILPGHKNWITSILFLDAKTMLSTSDDLTVCAWDFSTGKEIARIDFGAVGDCPRCLAQLGPNRFVVGTSSWLIYEFELLPEGKTKGGKGTSNP